jgi:LysM repeat protein
MTQMESRCPLPTGARRAVVAVLAGLAVVMVSAPAVAEPVIHLVHTGENLSELAQQYGVEVRDIRRWNKLRGELIRPGQPLMVGESQDTGDDDATEATDDDAPVAAAVQVEDTSASAPPGPACDEAAGADGEPPPRTYVVHELDTLGCIAARFGVTVDEIMQWNPGVAPDHIEAGLELAIRSDRTGDIDAGDTPSAPPTRRAIHVVRQGETLIAIADRYGTTVPAIVALNPDLEPDHIEEDQRLVVETVEPPSESLGSPTCGRLVNGRQLPPHPGYEVRDPGRAWGTEETLDDIREAFDAVRRAFPDAQRARVHDLSLHDGGPIDDHRSHQSGRDADITYFQDECPADDGCPLEAVLPRNMALGPQWTLIEHWLRNGRAQVIFIDYGLQEVLYNYARRHGASRIELEEWFQYPRGRSEPVGVIRHFSNHFDHLHVRFRCPEGDQGCR